MANVNLDSKTSLTIIFPAAAGYDISVEDFIDIDIDPDLLKSTSTGTYILNNAFSILPLAASITTSGNIVSAIYNKEDSIRSGGGEIVFNLTNDEWDPNVGDNHPLTVTLINSISGSSEWETKVKPAIIGSDQGNANVNVIGQTLTISLPGVPTYSIVANDILSVDIPASCLLNTSSGTFTSSPNMIVLPAPPEIFINDPGLDEYTVGAAVLTISLKDETFIDGSLNLSNFTSSKPLIISVVSVSYSSSTSADVTLSLIDDFDSQINDFSIIVDGVELTAAGTLSSNNIIITAQSEPEISVVTIVANTFKIGDVVPVAITVVADAEEYTDFYGTVAGRSLDSISKQNDSYYIGYFTVDEDGGDFFASDDIPVVGLQFDNLPLIGDAFDGQISNVTVIDATRPAINYMQVSGNSYKIGDQIDIIVSANDEDYSALSSTSVNSVAIASPSLVLQDIGNGVYLLQYTVNEGNNNVSTGALSAQLAFTDLAGNESNLFNSLTANSVSIDANSPQINSISLTNGIYSVDDVVEIVVTADENNYGFDLLTEVNGIPYFSSKITSLATGSGEYTLYYTVSSSDDEVDPGLLDVKVKMSDLAGNIAALYQTVEPNSLAIYTVLPTATIVGNQEICEDDSALLIVNLTGRFPLELYSFDGSTTTHHNGILASPYEFYVSPSASANFAIDSVLDFNGIKNSGSGLVSVTVNPKTDVSIINLNQNYSLEDDPILLEADILGGTFSGLGVISSTGYFNPGIADTTNSPHTIYYDYTNDDACLSVDSAVVFVLGAQGDISIQKTVYCDYESSFEVQASNTAGVIGDFRLLNSDQSPVGGLIDNHNNTASVSPTLLEEGIYTVEYKYNDGGASLILREDFEIEIVQTPKIITLTQDEFCQNDPVVILEGDIETGIFSGLPGVSGNLIDGFIFDPANADLGANTILYTNTTVNGCSRSVSKVVNVNFVPDVQFLESDVCIASEETIIFHNETVNPHTVSEWMWNYGDVHSGEDNFGTSIDGFHIYTGPGNRTIQLIAITPDGCSDTLSRTIDFGDKPDGSFHWTNECFLDGDSILFISDATSENDLILFNWTFFNSAVDSSSLKGNDSVYYTFSGIDDYTVKLNVETNIGCKNEFIREIVLKPTIRVVDDGYYFEDFENNNGRWSTNQEDDSKYNSWNYNFADFSDSTAYNSNAWFTDVPDSIVREQAWVISPCFNLRDLEKPMISMDIFRYMEDNEGVVLQSSVDNEITWQNVGTWQQGIEWFNDFQIANKPAGQEIGWSGTQDDEEWITAIRYIDELLDKPNVRFRMHYGTTHQLGLESKGFAFDNFKIMSRTRMVLMESFTNGSNTGLRGSDAAVNSLYRNNYSDVVKLEYHTDLGGSDIFNESNVFVPATRALYYGVNKLPNLILDGGGEGLLNFDSGAEIENLDDEDIVLQSLYEPIFDINLDINYGGSSLTIDVELSALEDLEADERILQVVVYEKFIDAVTLVNGQKTFLNVVKDMIPNAAGTAYFNAWEKAETITEQFSWNYSDPYNPEMLRIAVFVQNDNTREVYQAATDDLTNLSTDIRSELLSLLDLRIYPNPASHILNLNLQAIANEEFGLEIFDKTGRLIGIEVWPSNTLSHQIDVNSYQQGIYLIRMHDSNGSLRALEKFAVIR
ncbi:MAG: T9SS type A sorting domain-containing protein [Bacteroidales bacterium]|nr:T9SS type A sorting domain-containing protein [Bacteroidales bacterium]